MRRLVVVALLALVGCTSADGKPSPAGNAVGAFLKGFSQSRPAPAHPLPPATGNATWTGWSQQVRSVTGAVVWQCEYFYSGQKFMLLFDNTCPTSATVR